MKKILLSLIVSVLSLGSSFAQCCQQKSITVFGDSYSTFEGYITPSTNEPWYFVSHRQKDNDVAEVEQTWWHQLIKKNGWKLCMNNSYSGSTVSSSGYRGEDYTPRSFVTRMDNLGNPDIIFIFAGTNDSWVPSPIGEYKYSNWTKEDLKAFRPSLAKMLDYMTKRYMGVDLYYILNSELRDEINSSVYEICGHYNVPVITLTNIEKKAGHPSIAGMKAIAEQVDAFVKENGCKKCDAKSCSSKASSKKKK
ncbi:MAG: SGNH/GDSL hydrolase family protein [Bacteroidaceae bacterium]|nr:SGNH/GDSL hydrolase family protein [Bacteroidaceae bacterium]